MRMPALVLSLILIALPISAAGLQDLDALIGTWRGTSRGEPGEGKVTRVCQRVLNERFIECRTTSVYERETHVDVGYYSYDKHAKKLRLRQFHGEGFVNTYSADAGSLVFVTDEIENIPAGFRARETYEITADGWSERFEIAEPGKDFALYSATSLRRGD